MNTQALIQLAELAIQNLDVVIGHVRKDPEAWKAVSDRYNNSLKRFEEAARAAGKLPEEGSR